MRRPLIAGNWKMNGSAASVKELLSTIIPGTQKSNNVEIAVFPPFVYLQQVEKILTGTSVKWGAQNFWPKSNGAFTGEISISMLMDVHCEYVLVGHSERRTYFNESDRLIAEKCKVATESNVQPILCVGETQEQRDQNKTMAVIQQQLKDVYESSMTRKHFDKMVIAYEPVWAIGTGKTATPEQAQEVHAAIREMLTKKDREIAERTRIIYGGSVNASNAKTILGQPDIDGALVGSASLDGKQFIEIAQSCKSLF